MLSGKHIITHVIHKFGPDKYEMDLTARKDSSMLDLEKLISSKEELSLVRDMGSSPYGIFIVVGPTGSGKSTTANLLLGLIRPQKGNLELDGVIPIGRLSPLLPLVSLLPCSDVLFNKLCLVRLPT